MNIDSLLDHSSETHRIEAFYDALKLISDMDIRCSQGECWMDDYGPEDVTNDDGWMDDLDEAA